MMKPHLPVIGNEMANAGLADSPRHCFSASLPLILMHSQQL
ncbi:hypothetical protein RBA69_21395 [Brenneria goodwinii]